MSNPNAAVAPAQPFDLITPEQMFDTPTEVTPFCVDGLLPSSGCSILIGKPKSGKSTLSRQLAIAVAQGNPFLGRETDQGAVIYICLEEKRTEVAAHFQQLGFIKTDPIYTLCASVARDQAVPMLKATLEQHSGVKLVIIDPLFKFVGGVKDSNDYMQVNDALAKLLEVARDYGVHILILHHNKKRVTDDAMDGALGSTAITGAVDTNIFLNGNGGGVRTISTRQRYGVDLHETRLNWNADKRELSLGITADEAHALEATATAKRIEEDMITYVVDHKGCTQEAIFEAVIGRATTKKSVFRKLFDDKCFVQSGGGVKGDPYIYYVPERRVSITL